MARSYLPTSLTLYRVYFSTRRVFYSYSLPFFRIVFFVANFPGVEAARPSFTSSNDRLSISGGQIDNEWLTVSIDLSNRITSKKDDEDLSWKLEGGREDPSRAILSQSFPLFGFLLVEMFL